MTIPDYELLQHCGHGAYGEVWLARSRSGQLVALKLMEREIGMEKEFAGLVNYAKLKDSPHLIRILHTGETADGLYYTMELADNLGTAERYVSATLANILHQRKQLSPQETTTLGIQLLEGLRTLHDAGLVHRDVKPENILYVTGVPKLSDVGLVRRVSQTLSLGGTLGFLPPERLRSGSSSKSNTDDLYALGKVLYCCVTGNSVDEFPSFPPELIRNKECRKLNAVILTACDRNLTRRFRNATEFSQALNNGVSTGKQICSALHKLRYWLICTALLISLFWWIMINIEMPAQSPSGVSHTPPSALPVQAKQPIPLKASPPPKPQSLPDHSNVEKIPSESVPAEPAPQAQAKQNPTNPLKENWLTEHGIGFSYRRGMIEIGNDGFIQWKRPLLPPCQIRFQLLVDEDFDDGEFRSEENSARFSIQLAQPGTRNRNISQIQFHLQKNARGMLCWTPLEYQPEGKTLLSLSPLFQPNIENSNIPMELALEHNRLSVSCDGKPLFDVPYEHTAPVVLRFKTAHTIIGDVRIKDFSVFSEKEAKAL